MDYKNYEDIYCDRVVELLNVCFPDKGITKQSFLWKHYDAFFKGKTHGMVALDGDMVCAFVCFTPIYVNGNDKRYSFYSCAIQATHPEYRRRGIISDLTQLIEKRLGSDINYLGFSNADGVKIDKYSKKINYAIVGQMAKQCMVSVPYNTKYQSTEVKNIDTSLFRSTSPLFKINKDREYINWRYERSPKRRYYYLGIERGSEIVAYVVFNKRKFVYEISEILLKDASISQNEVIKTFLHFAFRRGKIFTSCTYLKNNFWRKSFPLLSLKRNINMFFTVKSADTSFTKVDSWLIYGGDIQ